MKSLLFKALLTGMMIVLAGCGSVGTNFDIALTENIENGKTTKAEIKQWFGKPFKTGIQNGDPIWVYERDTYKAIGEGSSKDLIIVFDGNGVVKSYKVMTSGGG